MHIYAKLIFFFSFRFMSLCVIYIHIYGKHYKHFLKLFQKCSKRIFRLKFQNAKICERYKQKKKRKTNSGHGDGRVLVEIFKRKNEKRPS